MIDFNSKLYFVFIVLLSIGNIILEANKEKEDSQFEKWKNEHKISYQSQFQENYRRKIFYENLVQVFKHNSDSNSSYKMGLNQFSALTKEQFVRTYLSQIQIETIKQIKVVSKNKEVDIDWTEKGAVGPVKNKSAFIDPWAYAVTASLEGLSKITTGNLELFSAQQLADCITDRTGTAFLGFQWVKQHGISTESEYPQEQRRPGKCKIPEGKFKIADFEKIQTCEHLSDAISKGPVSVLVDATNWASYTGGVFNKCGKRFNHSVTLVGKIQGVWKVKNNWGITWGQAGYMRLAEGNTCGICQYGIRPFK